MLVSWLVNFTTLAKRLAHVKEFLYVCNKIFYFLDTSGIHDSFKSRGGSNYSFPIDPHFKPHTTILSSVYSIAVYVKAGNTSNRRIMEENIAGTS